MRGHARVQEGNENVSERASIHTQRRRVLVTVPIQSVCFSRRKTDVEHSNQTMTGHPSEADSEEGLVSLRAATYRSSSLKQSRTEQSRAEQRLVQGFSVTRRKQDEMHRDDAPTDCPSAHIRTLTHTHKYRLHETEASVSRRAAFSTCQGRR